MSTKGALISTATYRFQLRDTNVHSALNDPSFAPVSLPSDTWVLEGVSTLDQPVTVWADFFDWFEEGPADFGGSSTSTSGQTNSEGVAAGPLAVSASSGSPAYFLTKGGGWGPYVLVGVQASTAPSQGYITLYITSLARR
jgi:hypothetical protein